MILVDTSIWIDHLRRNDPHLGYLLDQGRVLGHPFIVGELALGNLCNRDAVLEALLDLPQVPPATDDEVLRFIRRNALHGRGIGYIDAHLLASARLAPGTRLWTRDKRLLAVASGLDLAENATH